MQDAVRSGIGGELHQMSAINKDIEIPPLSRSLSHAKPVKSIKSLRYLRILQQDKLKEKASSTTSSGNSSYDFYNMASVGGEKKRFPGNMTQVMLKELKPSWTNFLEQYGSGERNLSVVERPMCFNGLGFMAPPDYRHEAKRTFEARCALESKVWKRPNKDLQEAAKILLRQYNLLSMTISVVDRSTQHVMFCINQNIPELPRNVSIDSHSILSSQFFGILDALKDWRFAFNPVVFGPPFIRFYTAVPLIVNGSPIGAVSVYDSSTRDAIPKGLIKKLGKIAHEISLRLTQTHEATAAPPSAWPSSLEAAGSMSARFETIAEDLSILKSYGMESKAASLKKLNCNDTISKAHAISKRIIRCEDVRAAFSYACKELCDQLKFDFAYIAEVRVSNKYFVPKINLAGYPSGVRCSSVKNIHQLLGKKINTNIQTRVLGAHNMPNCEFELDQYVHRSALNSSYGVSFCGEK